MLPFDTDSTEPEKLQWCLYQIQVLDKIIRQLTSAMNQDKSLKIEVILNLLYSYGLSLNPDNFEFELEMLLNRQEVFDQMRDLL